MTLTFQDIFKSSFLENMSGVSLLDMALALTLAFGIGLFIFLVYQKTYQGVMYSSSFGVTLIALTMITTLVILAVTSNVVLIPLAAIGSAVIGVVLLVFVNRKAHVDPYILVLQCDSGEGERQAAAFLEARTRRCTVKSKTVQEDAVELDLDVRLKDADTSFVNELARLPGVRSAVLVSYNGDYMG